MQIFTNRHGVGQKTLESREQIQLLLVEANQGSKTYNGVDWGAERAVEEVSHRMKVTRYSGCSHMMIRRLKLLFATPPAFKLNHP